MRVYRYLALCVAYMALLSRDLAVPRWNTGNIANNELSLTYLSLYFSLHCHR